MHFHALLERLQGPVDEQDLALQGEVRGIELQDVAAGDDVFVLPPQLAGQGEDVILVPRIGRVVRIAQQGGCEDAWGDSGDECTRELAARVRLRRERVLEQVEFLLRLGQFRVVAHGIHALRGRPHGSGLAGGGLSRRAADHQLRVARELGEVRDRAALGLAAEAGHAVLGVEREADARQFAVAGDVDARCRLLANHFPQAAEHLRLERAAVNVLSGFHAAEHVEQGRGPGQAADMGDQQAIVAMVHGYPSPLRSALRIVSM